MGLTLDQPFHICMSLVLEIKTCFMTLLLLFLFRYIASISFYLWMWISENSKYNLKFFIPIKQKFIICAKNQSQLLQLYTNEGNIALKCSKHQ